MKLVMRVLLLSALLLALGHAGTWKVVSKGSAIIFSFGISDSHGTAYAASIQNGVGSQVLKTDNLGVTWNVTHKGDELLMLGCGTLGAKDAVVSGALGEVIYTIDGGTTFKKSLALAPGSQSIETTPNRLMYGIAGGHGVHVSNDRGVSFKNHKIKGEQSVRYGAFLNEKVWYVSAGTFPTNNTTPSPTPFSQDVGDERTIRQLTRYYSLKQNTVTGEARHHIDHSPPVEGLVGNFSARIYKTADGGATWKKQFSSAGKYYFNGISCCNPKTCYVVGEGDASEGGVQGTVVFKTEDGETWKQVYGSNGDAKRSLMSARCLGDGSEAWVAGGNIERPGFQGEFYQTVDGGKTWKLAYVNKAASIMAMEFAPDFKSAMATGISLSSGGVVYQYA